MSGWYVLDANNNAIPEPDTLKASVPLPVELGAAMQRRLKAIDVFAGCGGCTVGLSKAGFEVMGAIEVSEDPATVYKLNHLNVHLWQKRIEDVSSREIAQKFELEPGDLDLLAGCPPCQGFSSVRTLNGRYIIDDERNDLIFEFERLIRDLRPKAVMLENVPGLATDRRLAEFVKNLETWGYTVNFSVLNAADYGVPQRRRRLILLAGRYGKIRFARRARCRRTVRDAIASLKPAGTSGDPIHDAPEIRSRKIRRLISRIPKNGGSRTDLPKRSQLECHKRCNGFKDIYGRMSWDAVAPTLTTGCFNPSRGRFLHPQENRAITMREAALLQTFPKRYKFPSQLGKGSVADMIGNAIPPELVRRHAASILRYLRLKRR